MSWWPTDHGYPGGLAASSDKAHANLCRSWAAFARGCQLLRKRPLAFTEQGIAMLSSVLNSDRAIEVNLAIMRAFVKLREIVSTHKELARKLEDIERKLVAAIIS